jgi:hypothetical protein
MKFKDLTNPDGLVRFYRNSDIENDVFDYEEIESE